MGDFTIQMSGNLINQLVNRGEKVKKRAKKSKPKVPQEPSQPQTKVNDRQFHDGSETQRGTASGWPVQPSLYTPVVNPPVQPAHAELDAIRSVLQESEKVLEKLQKQEDNMVQEVTEKAKDLHEKEFKLPYQKPMPCLADYDACRACYKHHTNDILKCAPFTRSYYECVQRARQQMSSADN
ncbi:hypothetical protein K2173_009953 [Erythroxylum novogranatense]|uniref:Uncharacterized protein n=1 Tax=Erythroxylum novogranatense TaxID=1862640 RepID=A0AAV8SZE9_9ROSI|nr:hypothetical protein K2173_009953 [Erythroxylum novogranatense]